MKRNRISEQAENDVDVSEDVFELTNLLLEKLAINRGKIDRLKDVTASSHTSIVSAENLLAVLNPNEIEKKCNIEQWFKKVRKVLLAFLTKLAEKHPCTSMDVFAFAHFIQSVHPPAFLDRPPLQSQQDLPDEVRCIALCEHKVRCFRQRNKVSSTASTNAWFCTHHQHYLPFGIHESYRDKVFTTKTDAKFDLPLRLVNYRGYFVYVDLLNNNVYYTEDIYQKKESPRIIGKYTIFTDETTLEERYIIPALDAFANSKLVFTPEKEEETT